MLSEEEIHERTLEIGKHLSSVVMQLTEFIDEELQTAEKAEQKSKGTEKESSAAQALKYWISLAGKTDTASKKVSII